jgi:hypothetical protein
LLTHSLFFVVVRSGIRDPGWIKIRIRDVNTAEPEHYRTVVTRPGTMDEDGAANLRRLAVSPKETPR